MPRGASNEDWGINVRPLFFNREKAQACWAGLLQRGKPSSEQPGVLQEHFIYVRFFTEQALSGSFVK
jgi:hypothetical protein